MLVNTAQALKYLEAYGQRQSQLFTVLEKYHQVSDGLEDLKSQFNFLKEATSRNIENLQQALNLQQTHTTALYGHINVIFSRFTELEADIQKFTEKFKMEQDTVQIDAPDFDPDIDGSDTQWVHYITMVVSVHELLTSPDPESADSSNTQEITDRGQFDTSHFTSEDPHRPHNLTQQVSDHPPEDTPTGQQVASTENNNFNKIPQLEEEEDDWENDQIADVDTYLINRQNTHPESEQIQKEYTEHLLELTDNQYYSGEYPFIQLQYSIPDPDYYRPQL